MLDNDNSTEAMPPKPSDDAALVGCVLSEIETMAKVAMMNAEEKDVDTLLSAIGRLAELAGGMAEKLEKRLMAMERDMTRTGPDSAHALSGALSTV